MNPKSRSFSASPSLALSSYFLCVFIDIGWLSCQPLSSQLEDCLSAICNYSIHPHPWLCFWSMMEQVGAELTVSSAKARLHRPTPGWLPEVWAGCARPGVLHVHTCIGTPTMFLLFINNGGHLVSKHISSGSSLCVQQSPIWKALGDHIFS